MPNERKELIERLEQAYTRARMPDSAAIADAIRVLQLPHPPAVEGDEEIARKLVELSDTFGDAGIRIAGWWLKVAGDASIISAQRSASDARRAIADALRASRASLESELSRLKAENERLEEEQCKTK